MRRLLILSALAALTIPAQDWTRGGSEPKLPPRQRSIAGPSLGLSFDQRTGGLRRVVGLPGAAIFGPAVEGGTAVVRAEVAPGGDSALGVTADGAVVRFRIGAEPEPLAVPPAPDLLAYSPEGGAAALLYAASGRIEVLRSEGGGTAGRTMETQSFGVIDVAAVADDGAVLVATSAGAVLLFGEPDAPHQVGTVRHASAAAFLPRSRDALVADDGDDQVFLLRAGRFVPLAGPLEGVADPAAVATYDAGRRALIANSRTASVLSIAVDGTAREIIDCACSPRSLRETSVAGVFWLAENTLFDARGNKRIWFVPHDKGGSR